MSNKELIELTPEMELVPAENPNDERSFVTCMVIGTILTIVAMLASGCTGSTGWQFQVGINPIKQVKNQQVLPVDQAKGKFTMLP